MTLHAWLAAVLLDTLLISVASGCNFPLPWRGDWYQADFRVYIDQKVISSPSNINGRCFQRNHHKYVLQQKEKSCYMCVVFTPRHNNIIQYKMGDCIEDLNKAALCQIAADKVLFTLLRLKNKPVPCPFEGLYDFTYDDGGTKCEKDSTIVSCADESTVKVSYKYCGPPGEGQDENLDLHCLATWQDDHHYLYAKRVGATIIKPADQYRCFSHEKIGSSGIISQSVDPSCRLSGGPSGGDFRIKLKKDISNWPKSECQFPHYLTKYDLWRDLTGRYQLKVDTGQRTIRLQKRTLADGVVRNDELFPVSLFAFRCLGVTANKFFDSRAIDIATHATTENCTSHYQCLRLLKKSSGVIELHIGAQVKSKHTRCSGREVFRNSTLFVYIPYNNKPSACPERGSYSFSGSSCEGTVNIGCDRKDEIVIETNCPKTGVSRVDILRCLRVWGGATHRHKHVIVDRPGDATMATACLTFEKLRSKLIIKSSPICGSRDTLGRTFHYRLKVPFGQCAVAPKSITKGYRTVFDRPGRIGSGVSVLNRGGADGRKTSHTVLVYLVLCATSIIR